MFNVVVCRKYARKTIRVVECDDVEAMLQGSMGECLLCGPCSHVEVGKRGDYWTVEAARESADDATEAAWEIVDTDPDSYSTQYLMGRKVHCESV